VRSDVEIRLDEELLQLEELGMLALAIPAGLLSDAVIGDQESPLLRLGQACQARSLPVNIPE
jgi:hypothetical protein